MRAAFGFPLLLLSLVGLVYQLRALAKARSAAVVSRGLQSIGVQSFWTRLVRVYYLVALFLCGNCFVGAALLAPPHSVLSTVFAWVWTILYLAVSLGFVANGVFGNRKS